MDACTRTVHAIAARNAARTADLLKKYDVLRSQGYPANVSMARASQEADGDAKSNRNRLNCALGARRAAKAV